MTTTILARIHQAASHSYAAVQRSGGGTVLHIAAVACLLLTMTGLSAALPASYADQADAEAGTVRILPATATVQAGETVTVEVWMEDAVNYYAVDVRIDFDPDRVSVPSGEVTPLWDLLDEDHNYPIRNRVDNEEGDAWYAITNLSPAEPFNGDGRICAITFSGVATGTTELDIYFAEAANPNGEEFQQSKVDGEIVVEEADGTTHFIYLPMIRSDP